MIQDANRIWIGQKSYTNSVLQKFQMADCKAINAPIDPSMKLVMASDDCKCIDQRMYQSAVGSLMHLSVKTRPDITYAVNCVTRFSSKPIQQHWNAVMRIMRYLKCTTNYGILYSKNNASNIVGVPIFAPMI